MESAKNIEANSALLFTLAKPDIKICYVAHLDMLGYKAFFEENPDKIDNMLGVINQAIEKMFSRLTIINSMFQLNTGIENIYKVRIFSDNILIWMEDRQTYEMKFLLLSLMELIKDFQINLISSYGIFLRGGIVKGEFAANDTFVFGKGLIDATELEAKTAIFPRVIIHKSVVDDLNKQISCEGSGACSVCKRLREIDKLFVAGTTQELSNRLIDAYKTFDEIVQAVPVIYCNPSQLVDLRETLHKQISIIQYASNHEPDRLEKEYQDAKKLTPNMISIFNKILRHQMDEYEKYCSVILKNCLFIDDDGLAVIDYLNIPDFLGVITSDLLTQAMENIKNSFPKFLAVVEEMAVFASQYKRDEYIKGSLAMHKQQVEDEIMQRMYQYEKCKGDKKKLSPNERVLKKFVWAMKYHNRTCDLLRKPYLKILHNISFDPIEDLLFVHIQPSQEVTTSEGIQEHGQNSN